MCLKLAAPYDGAAGVHDGVSSTIIGRAGAIVDSGAMPVAEKVGVGVYFKDIVSVGLKRDSMCSCGHQILDKVDDSISAGHLRVLGELGALIRCVSNIGPSALFQ